MTFCRGLSMRPPRALAEVTPGSQLVNADIVEQDVEVFPVSLAGRVTGSKAIAGEQLYGIDLEAGQAPLTCEIQVKGFSLVPISVDGMLSGPVDGYLNGAADPGNDSYLLKKAGPAIAGTEDIGDVNSFTRVTAATFGTCVKLHLSFGTQLLETRSRLYRIYGSADTDCIRLVLVIDAIAISNFDNISYLTN